MFSQKKKKKPLCGSFEPAGGRKLVFSLFRSKLAALSPLSRYGDLLGLPYATLFFLADFWRCFRHERRPTTITIVCPPLSLQE